MQNDDIYFFRLPRSFHSLAMTQKKATLRQPLILNS